MICFWCLILTLSFARFHFGQCTHELPCPKLIKQHVVPCNFSQFYYSLPLSRVSSQQGFIQLTYELWHLPCMFSVLFMTVHHILYFSPHDPIITEPRKAAGEVQLPDYIQVRWGKASEDWALGHGQTDLTSPSPTQTCSVSDVLHRWRTQTACCNSPLSWKVCNAFIYWILACMNAWMTSFNNNCHCLF